MKKIIQTICIIIALFIISGCSTNNNKSINEEGNDMEQITSINITINNQKYIVELENNETAQAFINKLPETFDMEELNGNEKYFYMDYSLPTNSSNPKSIKAGDIMLYGDNCLVIFYKSFETSYSYTKIGHINNLPELDNNNVTVKFEK